MKRLKTSVIAFIIALYTILVTTLAFLGWFLVDHDQRPGRFECRGERATAVVEQGQAWHGTDKKDVVVVFGNGNQVHANAGNDLICVHGVNGVDETGFSGSDIFAGSGSNTIITYSGSNNIDGGDGATDNDMIYLNGNDENASGGSGDDHIWALGAAAATIYGGPGNDLIIGSHGNDYLVGGSNNDVVLGNGGDDEILGLFGSNQLYGGNGQDTIDGGADFDFCQDFDENTIFTHCEEISQPLNPPLPESG